MAYKYYISNTLFCSFKLNFKSKFSLPFLHFSLIEVKAMSVSTWPQACGISTHVIVEPLFISKKQGSSVWPAFKAKCFSSHQKLYLVSVDPLCGEHYLPPE